MINNLTIFLDIDGVLNHAGKAFKTYKFQMSPSYGKWYKVEFSEDNLRNFNSLIDILGKERVDVVISSSWRQIFSLTELKNIFSYMSINCNITGVTKDLLYDCKTKGRGDEINQYIIDNNLNKENIIILDDNDDMVHDHLFERFVQTEFYDEQSGGFQEKHIDQVLNILIRREN